MSSLFTVRQMTHYRMVGRHAREIPKQPGNPVVARFPDRVTQPDRRSPVPSLTLTTQGRLGDRLERRLYGVLEVLLKAKYTRDTKGNRVFVLSCFRVSCFSFRGCPRRPERVW